jgi:hypothetical protein
MKKLILLVLFVSMSFAASKATKPYTFTSVTAAKASEVNKNFDSVYVPFNKVVDTLNALKDSTYTRAARATKGKYDSTVTADSVNARATRGIKAKLDSTLTVDSTKVRAERATKIKVDSTITVDSVNARAIGSFATRTLTADSVNVRAIGGTVKTDSINSIKGIKAPVFAGPLTGNVTGNCSGTAATVTTAAQPNITSVGTLSSLGVTAAITADSVNARAFCGTDAGSFACSLGTVNKSSYYATIARYRIFNDIATITVPFCTLTSNVTALYVYGIPSTSRLHPSIPVVVPLPI